MEKSSAGSPLPSRSAPAPAMRAAGRGLPALLFSMAAGLVCCYAMGTAWYVAVYARAGGQAGVAAVLSACVLPFIPADAAKLLLAALLSKRLAPLCSPERRRG